MEAFLTVHGPQLDCLSFPRRLRAALHRKLSAQLFDGGEWLSLERLGDGTLRCVAARDVDDVGGDDGDDVDAVWLVDHAWTFVPDAARAQLAAAPGLLARVGAAAGVRCAAAAVADIAGADGAADAAEEAADDEEADDEVEEAWWAGCDTGADSDDGSGDDPHSLRPRCWSPAPGDGPAERVLASAWRLCGAYAPPADNNNGSLHNTSPPPLLWYLPDELGCAMRHDDDPTVRMAPFLFYSEHSDVEASEPPFFACCLAWPLRPLRAGDEVTRDTLEGAPGCAAGAPGAAGTRAATLAAFYRRPLGDGGAAAVARRAATLAVGAAAGAARDTAAVAAEAAAAAAGWPPLSQARPGAAGGSVLRVHTDIDWVFDHLQRTDCAVTFAGDDGDGGGGGGGDGGAPQPAEHPHPTPAPPGPASADVLWLKASRPPAGANPGAALSQLEGEEAVVFKHRLARTCAGRPWLPPTFDLSAPGGGGLAALLAQQRADERGHAEAAAAAAAAAARQPQQPPLLLWLLKPWNAGRGQGVALAASAQEAACRALRSPWPVVAQRLLHPPALFRRRKFDLRLLLAVRDLHGGTDGGGGGGVPDAAVWRHAVVRAANAPSCPATPAGRADPQALFTSMRAAGFPEQAVTEEELAADLATAAAAAAGGGGEAAAAAGVGATGGPWPAARAAVLALLRGLVLDAAAAMPPQRRRRPRHAGGDAGGGGGCGWGPRDAALYGVDVLLTAPGGPAAPLVPWLLEVTFCPGLERALALQPGFVDAAAGFLFRGEAAQACGFEPLFGPGSAAAAAAAAAGGAGAVEAGAAEAADDEEDGGGGDGDGCAPAAAASLFAEPPGFLAPPPAPSWVEHDRGPPPPPGAHAARAGPRVLRLRLAPRHSLHGHRLWNAAVWMAAALDAGGAPASTTRPPPAPPASPSAPFLAAPPPASPLLRVPVAGLRVLELGAGAGLPTLVAALRGAALAVATDYATPADSALLDALAANCAELARLRRGEPASGAAPGGGGWSCDPVALPFVWGTDPAALLALSPGGYDVVIGCDLLFARAAHAALARSLAALLAPGPASRVLLAYSHHDPGPRADADEGFFAHAAAAGLGGARVARWAAPAPNFVEDDGLDGQRAVVHAVELRWGGAALGGGGGGAAAAAAG